MSESPLVSVAMPVYNAEEYLKYSIDSVLSQTYTNFELILVNDASKDHSKEIIHSYSDHRIRYFENDENAGIVRTRNKCITLSGGKYIAVLDNDDIAMPTRLEEQVKFLEANEDHGLCGSFYEMIDESGNVFDRIEIPTSPLQIKTHLLFNNFICNSSVMIRSAILKESLYPEGLDMVEDYYFLYNVSKKMLLANLPLFITQYRLHGKNTSIKKEFEMRRVRKEIDVIILNDLKIHYTPEELDLHSNFIGGNYSFFTQKEQLAKLENWLLRLYTLLGQTNMYDMDVVAKILTVRWIRLNYSKCKLSARILFNKLFWKLKTAYVKYTLEIITNKFEKKSIPY